MKTIRLMGKDGQWTAFNCIPSEQTGDTCTLFVPTWDAKWYICKTGMIANVGGNDWRIYTLHADDCAALCAVPERSAT